MQETLSCWTVTELANSNPGSHPFAVDGDEVISGIILSSFKHVVTPSAPRLGVWTILRDRE